MEIEDHITVAEAAAVVAVAVVAAAAVVTMKREEQAKACLNYRLKVISYVFK
jgi:hypothetical protein